MSEDSRHYEEASAAIPAAWYENIVASLACTIAVGLTIKLGQELNPEIAKNTGLRIISVALYVYGSVLDTSSTIDALSLSERAERMGIRNPVRESNILLPSRPSPSEFLRSPKQIADYLVAGIAVILPEYGIPVGFARGLAALNNYRKVQRLERSIDIASGR